MRTVLGLLHESAEKYGSMPFLGQKTSDAYSTISFSQTDTLSLRFAAALVGLGFARGDNIALLSEGRSTWVIGEFAVLKAGCVSVPLSTKLAADEIAFRLNHSESKGILVSENNFSKLVETLEKLRSRPKVIVISERTPALDAVIAESRLRVDEELFFYDDLVERGRRALEGSEGADFSRTMASMEASISEDDVVTISYTSGTTGNPKGIMLTHRNYRYNAEAAAQIVYFKPGWKSLIVLPLDHSFAHTVAIYLFLHRGVCIYFVDARGGALASLRNLQKNLVETNPDVLLTVPALTGNFMRKMIQAVNAKGALIRRIFEAGVSAGIARAGDGFDRPPLFVRLRSFFPWALANALVFPRLREIFGEDLKFCIGGGALLEMKQQEFFNAIGVPIFQGYGLTENAPIISTNAPQRHKFGTSGVLLPGLEVRVMKDENTECSAGEVGQIVVAGPSVMKGYYKNPEATSETVRDGRLWTGDLGTLDPDGFLSVTGRERALLIASDGEKYSPETIEEAILNTAKFVRQVMVYNDQRKFTGALLTIDVDAIKLLLAESSSADSVLSLIRSDLLDFARSETYSFIPSQWRPASFALLTEPFSEENGLINSTMKLVRRKACEVYADRIADMYASETADPYTESNRAAVVALGLAD